VGYVETNVRVPPCASAALQTIAARAGTSRDETIRRLLSEHVERQEHLDPEERLTHVSTVLRYPMPPFSSHTPRLGRPLRLRLPFGFDVRARAVSLQLPGQSRRAHRDYEARPLTDAVMTAIAVEEPFADAHTARPAPNATSIRRRSPPRTSFSKRRRTCSACWPPFR
jgi:hypothetical protein